MAQVGLFPGASQGKRAKTSEGCGRGALLPKPDQQSSGIAPVRIVFFPGRWPSLILAVVEMPRRSKVRRLRHRVTDVRRHAHATRAQQHATDCVIEMLVTVGMHIVWIEVVGVVNGVCMLLLTVKSRCDFWWWPLPNMFLSSRLAGGRKTRVRFVCMLPHIFTGCRWDL